VIGEIRTPPPFGIFQSLSYTENDGPVALLTQAMAMGIAIERPAHVSLVKEANADAVVVSS